LLFAAAAFSIHGLRLLSFIDFHIMLCSFITSDAVMSGLPLRIFDRTLAENIM